MQEGFGQMDKNLPVLRPQTRLANSLLPLAEINGQLFVVPNALHFFRPTVPECTEESDLVRIDRDTPAEKEKHHEYPPSATN